MRGGCAWAANTVIDNSGVIDQYQKAAVAVAKIPVVKFIANTWGANSIHHA
ncbi:hypothetical protein GCM10007895_33830 [Paraferrimonas sedimenticola]|uniref:Uncharacterized protein n=1 Tax=Paraferrimonas sedimenticola TaxID=375674 RepID=A0AA37RZ74_9GAMM|nr:hypothetical protein GCM10007895_33830 [Paraferrimonas sedimenticola]